MDLEESSAPAGRAACSLARRLRRTIRASISACPARLRPPREPSGQQRAGRTGRSTGASTSSGGPAREADSMTWNRTAILAALPVAAVAVIAGVVSFSHIEALGLRTGQTHHRRAAAPARRRRAHRGRVGHPAGRVLARLDRRGPRRGRDAVRQRHVRAAARAARGHRRGLARDRVHGGQLHARALAEVRQVSTAIRQPYPAYPPPSSTVTRTRRPSCSPPTSRPGGCPASALSGPG